MDDRQREWDASYDKKQNFLFWPNEEVIRFVARFFRQRTGLATYRDKRPFQPAPRALDLGCGIGRHVFFLDEVGFESFGIDLSARAIATAREWAAKRDLPAERLVLGTSATLPWAAGFFDCVVSHGVLDSMPFSVALQTMREVDRVLSPDGLAYVDLISGDDDRHYREYAGEEVVEGPHETGTIQSYFNLAKIHRLVEDTGLEVREAVLVRRMRVDAPRIDARYHLVLGRP